MCHAGVDSVTTAFSSLDPGIGGMDSAIAVAGVHSQGETLLIASRQLAGLPQVIARVTGRTSSGAPLKNWGEQRPRSSRVDSPGPTLCPNIASIKHCTIHNHLGCPSSSFRHILACHTWSAWQTQGVDSGMSSRCEARLYSPTRTGYRPGRSLIA